MSNLNSGSMAVHGKAVTGIPVPPGSSTTASNVESGVLGAAESGSQQQAAGATLQYSHFPVPCLNVNMSAMGTGQGYGTAGVHVPSMSGQPAIMARHNRE